jgi:hypothetical protein
VQCLRCDITAITFESDDKVVEDLLPCSSLSTLDQMDRFERQGMPGVCFISTIPMRQSNVKPLALITITNNKKVYILVHAVCVQAHKQIGDDCLVDDNYGANYLVTATFVQKLCEIKKKY